MNDIQFIHAPSADLSKTIDADITVEAEYGTVVAKGRVYTAAHHQKGMEDLPAPCNDSNIPVLESGTVLVSHVDLDTFGGCLRACGIYSSLFVADNQSFWDLAQFVDLNGPHKLGVSGASDEDILRLYAFWAWQEANVPRLPRDEISDVTAHVEAAGSALDRILRDDEELSAAGAGMRETEAELSAATFERMEGAVIVRRLPGPGGFCNHLYVGPDGRVGRAIATYTAASGGITISLADPIEGVSCRDIMQELWGPEAGGHDGIAGGPRERRLTEADFKRTVAALDATLAAAL